jgi:antitoxin ParD1/3/4
MAAMPTMNVSLPDELSAFVAEQIEEGGYNNQSEVVREGLRLLQNRQAKLRYLRDAVGTAVANIDAGRTAPLTSALLRDIAERGRKAAASEKKHR